jgi:serine phosphatase RsbU (regulator of sigma subunit)
LVIVTDGITEALGREGRFGEDRLHAELSGAGDPALIMRRLETALNTFTEGRHDDDVAILALARGTGETSLSGSLVAPEVALTAQDMAGLDV